MARRLPKDCFARYVALGDGRSYEALARELGCSKRAVTSLAKREDWAGRLRQVEQKARAHADEKLAESLQDLRTRHMRMLRAMAGRALEALRQYPLGSGMEAMRAGNMIIKLERLVAGEASERTELSVEEVTKREMRRWLVPADAVEEDSDAADEDQDDRDE